ncbi:MAG: hypothetical protein Q9190_006347 [Brigantiaea leucoxantha]
MQLHVDLMEKTTLNPIYVSPYEGPLVPHAVNETSRQHGTREFEASAWSMQTQNPLPSSSNPLDHCNIEKGATSSPVSDSFPFAFASHWNGISLRSRAPKAQALLAPSQSQSNSQNSPRLLNNTMRKMQTPSDFFQDDYFSPYSNPAQGPSAFKNFNRYKSPYGHAKQSVSTANATEVYHSPYSNRLDFQPFSTTQGYTSPYKVIKDPANHPTPIESEEIDTEEQSKNSSFQHTRRDGSESSTVTSWQVDELLEIAAASLSEDEDDIDKNLEQDIASKGGSKDHDVHAFSRWILRNFDQEKICTDKAQQSQIRYQAGSRGSEARLRGLQNFIKQSAFRVNCIMTREQGLALSQLYEDFVNQAQQKLSKTQNANFL